jgi:hypothetical protein
MKARNLVVQRREQKSRAAGRHIRPTTAALSDAILTAGQAGFSALSPATDDGESGFRV